MRNLLVVMLAFVSLVASGQYKKTARQSKRVGKVYGITARAAFITQNKCVQPSLAYGFGRDMNEKRFFNWHQFEMLLPATYKYNTTYLDYNGTQGPQPVTVKAKAVFGFAYRFNYAYYLADNSNADNKVLPYVNLGVSSLIHFGSGDGYVTNPENLNGYLDVRPMDIPSLSFGLNGGLGVLFRVSDKFGINLTGGYNLQSKRINLDDLGDVEPEEDREYFYYKSHPYFTFGLRFRISSDEE